MPNETELSGAKVKWYAYWSPNVVVFKLENCLSVEAINPKPLLMLATLISAVMDEN